MLERADVVIELEILRMSPLLAFRDFELGAFFDRAFAIWMLIPSAHIASEFARWLRR